MNTPFPYKKESAEFFENMISLAGKIQRQEMSQFISVENFHAFRHGRTWTSNVQEQPEQSKFEIASVEITIDMTEVLAHNVSHLMEFLRTFVEGFQSQMMGKMYKTVGESAEKVGNVTNRSEFASNADAYLDALKKVEFGVNAAGEVTLPQLHVAPGMASKLLEELKNQPPEYQEEVQRVTEEKQRQALEKERIRKSKFVGLSSE